MAIPEQELKNKVEALTNLPTLPGVVKVICSMVDDEETSAQDIGKVISRDQVLSAKLLRLVNSPVYGFPGRISSVTHALVLLGFNVVKGLVLSSAVFDTLASGVRGLWEHSLGSAIISRRIAKELKLPQSEEAMVAGLLHDLGKVVMSFVDSEGYERALAIAEREECHIAVAERQVYGVDHTRVAGWLAVHWHLPERLTDTLIYHHNPSRAKTAPEATAVVHLADILARGMGYGSGGDIAMPNLDHEAFQLLNISYAQIDKVLMDSEAEFTSGLDVLRESVVRS